MTKVFVLQHEHEWCDRGEVKFIGVYATQDDALAASNRLRVQPGFRDWPDGFSIDGYELGVDHWIEGFITVVHILVPSRTNPGAFLVAGSVWRPGNVYEITDILEPDDAVFEVGDVVRCKETGAAVRGESSLVASEIVLDDGAEIEA